MNNEFTLSSGQAHELELAFRKTGWSNADVKKLCSHLTLKEVLTFVKGHADIVVREHVINTDEIPDMSGANVQSHAEIELHVPMGQLKWDPKKVKLHVSAQDSHDGLMDAAELHEEMKDKKPLNMNVLRYLLNNQTLIPSEWQPKTKSDPRVICFWGTIGRRINHDDEKYNYRFVDSMVWSEEAKTWHHGGYQIEKMQGEKSWIPKNTASAYLAS